MRDTFDRDNARERERERAGEKERGGGTWCRDRTEFSERSVAFLFMQRH